MRPHRHLKILAPTAEVGWVMTPGRILRPFLARIGVAFGLLTALVPLPGTALAGPLDGDSGGGPPAVLAPVRATKFTDVSSSYWASGAIDYVAGEHRYMRDFGSDRFRPKKTETRALFARAVVEAFAPSEAPDRKIDFADLPKDDPLYPYANVAVKLGWMQVRHHKFQPDKGITENNVHRALVFAVGLRAAARGLDHIHTADGYELEHNDSFATLALGMRLGLRYNHSDESMDVTPKQPLPRAEVAYSLYKAKTLSSWEIDSLDPYRNIELPKLSKQMRRVAEYAFEWVGYPYVWGGEWWRNTPAGYPYGAQPGGGFDCSGITWFVMRTAASGWDPPRRPYRGWSLPQRTSADMASSGGRVGYHRADPGDLMFYGSGGQITHVDVFLGKAWAIDSSSSNGGVTIVSLAPGTWYRGAFKHARDITR